MSEKVVKIWSQMALQLGGRWHLRTYRDPSESMLCRIRRHQNAFRHHFWWLYIRICTSNYKKNRVTEAIWWPNMSNFGFQLDFWKLLSESVKITISTLETTPIAIQNYFFMFHLGN